MDPLITQRKSLPARLGQDLRVHHTFWPLPMEDVDDGLGCLHRQPYDSFSGQGSSVRRENHIVQLL